MYYGVDDQVSSNQQEDPLDIDSVGFKVDLYLEKLLKELSLTELFDKERQMKRGDVWNIFESPGIHGTRDMALTNTSH